MAKYIRRRLILAALASGMLATGLGILVQNSRAGVACSVPFTLTNGTVADATQVMANYNALITCLGLAAGAGANSDITSLTAITTALSPTFGGTNTFYATAASGGSANAQTITVIPATSWALNKGYMVRFFAGFTNTGTTTLAVNGGTVQNIFKSSQSGPVALAGGEITANNAVEAIYDGTQFQLTRTINQGPTYQIFNAFTSGGTYTTPAKATWLKVMYCGPGGGGGATGTGAGGASNGGGTTNFNAAQSAPVGFAGVNGAGGGVPGQGQAPVIVGQVIYGEQGNAGGPGFPGNSNPSGNGGSSPVGGGAPSPGGIAAGNCAGGAGGSTSTVTGGGGGGGGGALHVILIKTPLAATYPYNVGNGGTGGSAGTSGSGGGNGGDGKIIVEEHYD